MISGTRFVKTILYNESNRKCTSLNALTRVKIMKMALIKFCFTFYASPTHLNALFCWKALNNWFPFHFFEQSYTNIYISLKKNWNIAFKKNRLRNFGPIWRNLTCLTLYLLLLLCFFGRKLWNSLTNNESTIRT